ncbi:signal recognition particle 68 kda protein-like protein [Calycina marina]|uniref:Signal recognition particle subunit SRP68 n=1 Tax=Calycina marina TaxID=1763456 RepID=A0A9P8CDJ6_9HELO|nr:signal recognition particle 68 kda protein-like protein [Calycina marina]
MEVTKFVVSGREKAKVFGDYSTYRTQLSNQIHNLRKKLGVATKPRAKYTTKSPITAEDIGRNHEFANLLLLTSERAWANAMSMREIHFTEKNGITGTTRSHIISRLHKATIYANDLFDALTDQAQTRATLNDVLEARAYAASLMGAKEFEKQSWEVCVMSYSEARIIYSALATSTKQNIFTDLLADPIDDSIRYGAYQMGVPRTVSITSISRRYFIASEPDLVAQVQQLDPDVLSDQPTKEKTETAATAAVPKTISWRSRTVNLEDAAIATALASVNEAAAKLSETLASAKNNKARDKASAYDDILIYSQDAVDATKHAIDELTNEKVGPGDKRMQSLQITKTAVSYDMISWRIGRNRVLVGDQDGAVLDTISRVSKKRKQKDLKVAKEPSTGRRLALLREKIVLYDGILQSLDSIKELPGVANDSDLVEELDAKYGYFSALKCLAIARSHTILSSPAKALALLVRASQKSSAHSPLSAMYSSSDSTSPPNITITPTQVTFLNTLLRNEVQRYRALVELFNLSQKAETSSRLPLVERLSQYPAQGVDLENIVTWPPIMEPIPVKPLFFDAAWNYIEYPGREVESQPAAKSAETKETREQTAEQKKKGWFGFGR